MLKQLDIKYGTIVHNAMENATIIVTKMLVIVSNGGDPGLGPGLGYLRWSGISSNQPYLRA